MSRYRAGYRAGSCAGGSVRAGVGGGLGAGAAAVHLLVVVRAVRVLRVQGVDEADRDDG